MQFLFTMKLGVGRCLASFAELTLPGTSSWHVSAISCSSCNPLTALSNTISLSSRHLISSSSQIMGQFLHTNVLAFCNTLLPRTPVKCNNSTNNALIFWYKIVFLDTNEKPETCTNVKIFDVFVFLYCFTWLIYNII